jgi:uncharacterized membrane protein YczE
MAAWTRRAVQFAIGLALVAAGVWLSLQAGLGLASWDVLHAGLAGRTGLSFGTVVMLVGVLVLAASWLMGVRPGIGTLVNVVAVGLALDRLVATPWLDGLPDAAVAVRVLVLLAAVVLLGLGAALYIGAGFGAGPRDSLMVACHDRGMSIGAARCLIELSVVAVGWLLGGPVGLGTLVVAFTSGPAVQLSFRLLRQQPAARPARAPRGDGSRPPRGARRGRPAAILAPSAT